MSELPLRAQVRLRWAVALVVGMIAGVAVGVLLGVAAGFLAGWTALAVASAGWTLLQVWPMDATETRLHATAEDPGRNVARVIAIVGSVVSLGAVAAVVLHSRHSTGIDAYLLAGIAVLSVISSWLLIQTDYMLRYAKEYYEGDARGIDFNQAEDPEYSDFIYFSVGLGIAYQVADTNISRNAIRRIVIAQTLLGYLFGAGIIATTINLIAGLG